jgi:integrase
MNSAITVLQGRPYHKFINAIKSEETKEEYRRCLLRYLSHYKTTLEDMLTLPIADIENMLVDYLLNLRKQDLSSSYINMNFCALKLYYFMNDVRINKEKIGKYLGESKKKNVDRSYTHPEIKSLIDIADLRLKVVISILASTGMRIGALPPLKLSHLEKKSDVYKFKIYENTKDESICFCSPECAKYIDSYLDFRTRSGEHLDDKEHTYLIREQFDINDIEQIRKQGRSIARDSIANMLYSLAIKSGLRKVNHQFTGRERKPVPLAHGFRKFFTTQLINAKVNPEIREMLLGHSIGLASAYYKPTEDEMLEEYMKAADNLTINEENRLRRKVEVLTIEKSKVDLALSQIEEMKKRIGL